MTIQNNIENKAILVSLSIKKWALSKKSKEAGAILATHYGAKNGAHSGTKHLLGGKENNSFMDKVEQIRIKAQDCRDYFLEQTLPWANSGERILLLRNKDKFDQKMRSLEGEFLKATKEFCKVYPQAKAEAKGHLGKDFSDDDFPQDIASKYTYELNRSPITTGKDFRVDLMGEEIKEMSKALDERNKKLTQEAMKEAFQRITKELTPVKDYFDKVNSGNEKARFHPSLIQNLNNLVEVIPNLNLTDCKELKDLAQEVKKEFGDLSKEKIVSMDKKEKESKARKLSKSMRKSESIAEAILG